MQICFWHEYLLLILTPYYAVTPEKLCTPEFIELLDAVHETGQLRRLVVDEVCQ